LDLFHHRAYFPELPHVRTGSNCTASELLDLSGQGLGRGSALIIVEENIGTFFSQFQGNAFPDPPARSGNDCCFSL
jgi:hypothetical protein